MITSQHQPEDEIRTFRFGQTVISAINLQVAVDYMVASAATQTGGYVTCCNTHSVVESSTDRRFREILNGARLNLPDGMPTVWIGRLKRHQIERVDGPSLFLAMLNDPRARNLRHYFYGGSEAVIVRIVERATSILGPNGVAGAYSPPVRKCDEAESADVVARISAAHPDIIWVGLGLPKQEYWMARHSPLLPASQMVGVGAAFDWFAGTKRRAPLLMQRLGLEWMFRLAVEPRRLWRRYSFVVPRALWIMVCEVFRAGQERR